MGRAPKHPPLVYVLRRRDGLLRIGTTTDLDRRCREHARRCKGRLELLATTPGGREVEASVHARFAADCVDGEAFRPSPALLAWVEGLKVAQRNAGVATDTRPASPFARTLPPWVAVELRPGLPTCGCVQTVSGRAYAAGACGACHGAGVTFVAPLILTGRAA